LPNLEQGLRASQFALNRGSLRKRKCGESHHKHD